MMALYLFYRGERTPSLCPSGRERRDFNDFLCAAPTRHELGDLCGKCFGCGWKPRYGYGFQVLRHRLERVAAQP